MTRAPRRSRRRTAGHGVRIACAAALIGVTAAPPAAAQAGDERLDEAVATFWAATDESAVAAATADILAADPEIEAIWSRLRRGRTYDRDVPTGRRLLQRTNADGTEHPYVVHVPAGYDPGVRYPVRVYLHGGVARPKRDDGDWWRDEARVVRDDTFVVLPLSWDASLWWQDSQIENLVGILTDLKRTYNLDENRVFLLGISDGATGAFYHALKATTPWAAFLPFNGHPVVLANPASDTDGELHATNLRNKPLYVVNGGRDPLYPAASVVPYMRLFRDAGALVDFRPQEDAGHDMSWWEAETPTMDAFMSQMTRRPMPPRLSWETERTDRYHRAHWLVITELGSVAGEPSLDPFNEIMDPTQGMPLGINMLGELQDGTGLRIFEVGADSIASAAGLVNDDTIVEVDGHLNPSVDDLKEALIGFAPGQQIPLRVLRGGERVVLTLDYPADAAPTRRAAFPRTQPSGRVELDQRRNQVMVYTRGVRRFTLLLSPEQFDFTEPITVVTNGVTVFDELVEPDVATLLRWAARDQDRTALFGAELEIEVESEP